MYAYSRSALAIHAINSRDHGGTILRTDMGRAPLCSYVNMLMQYIVPQYMGYHSFGKDCACHRAVRAMTLYLLVHIVAPSFSYIYGTANPARTCIPKPPSPIFGSLRALTLVFHHTTQIVIATTKTNTFAPSVQSRKAFSSTFARTLSNRYQTTTTFSPATYTSIDPFPHEQDESARLWGPGLGPVPAAPESMHVEKQCHAHDISG
jgi:hypothetical protein